MNLLLLPTSILFKILHDYLTWKDISSLDTAYSCDPLHSNFILALNQEGNFQNQYINFNDKTANYIISRKIKISNLIFYFPFSNNILKKFSDNINLTYIEKIEAKLVNINQVESVLKFIQKSKNLQSLQLMLPREYYSEDDEEVDQVSEEELEDIDVEEDDVNRRKKIEKKLLEIETIDELDPSISEYKNNKRQYLLYKILNKHTKLNELSLYNIEKLSNRDLYNTIKNCINLKSLSISLSPNITIQNIKNIIKNSKIENIKLFYLDTIYDDTIEKKYYNNKITIDKYMENFSIYDNYLNIKNIEFNGPGCSRSLIYHILPFCSNLESLTISYSDILTNSDTVSIFKYLKNLKNLKLENSNSFNIDSLLELGKSCGNNLNTLIIKKNINKKNTNRILSNDDDNYYNMMKNFLLSCPNLIDLCLVNIIYINDHIIKLISTYLTSLSSLDISENFYITDLSLEYLINSYKYTLKYLNVKNCSKLTSNMIEKLLNNCINMKSLRHDHDLFQFKNSNILQLPAPLSNYNNSTII